MFRLKDPFVIPEERLPPGFVESIAREPVVPVEPRPAATAVLMRDARGGPEVLLLKRHRSSGFVPGAYVFPGGRVDAADGLVAWERGEESGVPGKYWVAAIREIFEETGVLLARSATGEWARDASSDAALEGWRERLMGEAATLSDVLRECGLELDGGEMAYMAHWITPVVEPRRYDTRFFVARLPEGREVRADAREMDDAVWLSARGALERFGAGRLPMVFPTVKTLQALQEYATVAEVLEAFRSRVVTPILPRLVRTPEGVGIVIDQDD